MADSQSTCSYKEIRLNLESAIPSSNVVIRLPSTSALSRTAPKRPYAIDLSPAEDETHFKQKYLATASSIYHRKHHKSPRSFLWRVLEDGKVFTVRVADVCKPQNSPDLPLTLRFHFPQPIKQGCIALADSAAHNVLSVFALTESNHLYTLTLRPEYFRRIAPAEENAADWHKVHLSSAFSFKHAHRLAAISGEEVVIALHDGGLLKLTQRPGDDGSSWRETFYNAGSWKQGLRSLIPFHSSNTVRYGKANLELAAITSLASETTLIDDTPYLFTVSLDHRLRAWDMDSGKVSYVGDILGQERQPNEIGRYTIHPSQSQLVRVCNDSYGKVVIVTYSPIAAGEFKIWTASPAIGGGLNISDVFPDDALVPTAPTSDVWTVSDFWAVWNTKTTGTLTLWVLWKNNVSYRLQRLDFELDPSNGVRQAWQSAWEIVASETLHDSNLPAIVSADPTDITEKWLEFILYPGKFTVATVETALSIYEHGLGVNREPQSQTSKSLPEKLSLLVASTATLLSGSNGVIDYEQFRKSADAQWRRFYRLVLELQKQQGEALSLAFDVEAEMPWVVLADGVAAVRKCSPVELLWHNPDIVPTDVAEFAASLVNAASSFREGFSNSLLYACNTALSSEVLSDPTLTHSERMRAFYERCNFQGQISDEDWSQLVANIGGNFGAVTLEAYESLLKAMLTSEGVDDTLTSKPLAEFGRKMIMKGIQETVSLHRMICFDQLVLLIFMQAELDPQDDGFSLDAAEVFEQLLVVLKRLELMAALAQTKMSIPTANGERVIAKSKSSGGSKKTVEEATSITALEGCMEHLFGLKPEAGDLPSILTDVLIEITDPMGRYELQPALIQCYLLKKGRPDLALEIGKFSGQDPFSVYVQGRAYLAAKELSTAATLFRKAAYELGSAISSKINGRHSAGFIDDMEWNLLNAGLPKYYSHLVALFDKDRHYSYVIEFASLSLQFIPSTAATDEEVLLRTEMQSRQFNAAIQICFFDVAHSTLTRFTDRVLQQAYVRTLVVRMCETGNSAQLLKLPFIGLQDTVENVLAQKAHSIVDVHAGIPYHNILYAWRIKHHNFRGAAAIMLERLQRLQQLSGSNSSVNTSTSSDEFDTPITRAFLTTINALSCVEPKQAWILAEGVASKGAEKETKRRVVTLQDLRRAYQAELDRIAAIENGQFGLIGGQDEMEVDVL